MHRSVIIRALIALLLLAFASAPWQQALAASPTSPCGSAGAFAQTLQAGTQMDQAANGGMAQHAKAKAGECAKVCAALQMLAAPDVAVPLLPAPQARVATALPDLPGLTLEPELSPPIG